MARFAPRIHVLLARDARTGVVIRRGPSKSVATMLWDRKRDVFHMGQWLKGRIYERRCDLSPDGKYLIYFAMNGRWTSPSTGSWSAISHAPYLKAVAFFPKGDCWHGGGLWTGKNTYWLNDGHGREVPLNTTAVRRDLGFEPTPNYGGECLGVYYHRLLRDGWSLINRQRIGKLQHKDVFEKKISKGWVLRKIAHAEIGAPVGKSPYWDEHELVHPIKNLNIPCPSWEWAEMDGNRIVWAANGRLYASKLSGEGVADAVELHDFNEMTFEAIEAPY